MHPYTSNTSPNPADSSDSSSSAASTPRPRFPSTVELEHLSGVRLGDTSEGTSPTCIETSPLTTTDLSPVEYKGIYHHEYKQKKPKRRVYNNGNNKVVVVTATNSNVRKKGKQKITSFPHETSTHCQNFYAKQQQQHQHQQRHVNKQEKNEKQNNDTLTWRMDPSASLSDFALTIIGIDDRSAIRQYLNDKKRKKEKKKQKIKRRDLWMVEGLYLDMSQSEDEDDDDNEDDDDCHNHCNSNYDDEEDHYRRSIGIQGQQHYGSGAHVIQYHLHKVNLAVGLKSCDYFAHLFQKKDASNNSKITGNNGNNNNISKHTIEIPLSCLPAIPAMLDYLYNPTTTTTTTTTTKPTLDVHATTSTAVPLRYLSTLLGNQSLFDSATRFLHADLCPQTAIEYLQHAELYEQRKLKAVCVRILAERFDTLKITWFAKLPPPLMVKILHSRYFTREMDSLAVCSKIASYCRCQSHKIDRVILLLLTSVKVMPIVCPEEALFLLRMMIRLGFMDDTVVDQNNRYISSKERSLYERCIDAAPVVVQGVIDSLCGKEGNNADNPHGNHYYHGGRRKTSRQTKNACGDYARLPPQIKVDLLEYALARQQKREDGTDKQYRRIIDGVP